jgi:REP element-mobilizing transposase RayT
MPRTPRSFAPGGRYHLTARGNDDRAIFVDDVDRARFVSLLGRAASRFELDVLAWCLLTTHYHLIVELRRSDLSRALQYLNGEYARCYNERHGRTGHLFRSRFRATLLVDEDHFSNAIDYVRHNPVRAGLVAAPADWPWAGAVGAAP